MQEFSIAFGRVSRAAIAADPELKNQVVDLLNRAYFNLHAAALTTADPQWVAAMTATAFQLCLDARVQPLSPRERVQLFENVVRISEEHQREARRHAAMAANVFYLKETSLDAILVETQEAAYHPAPTKVFSGRSAAHTGRVDVPKPGDPIV